ncbi:MAG: hypothetical protein K0V04_42800 [Deltaproteobacteria bacterium]|nr:hypothetical protein [Deltaproteobacteria bacterium]
MVELVRPVSNRIRQHRMVLRGQLREIRWLKRVIVGLAIVELLGLIAVVWRVHSEYLGG